MEDKLRIPPLVAKRNVNFEILRSLSMLFIVMLHYLKSVGDILRFDIHTGAGIINYVLSTLCFIFFSTAVPCFVMITGFFLVNKTEFNIKRIEKTWLRAFFIVLPIYIVAFLIDHDISHLKDVFSILFMGFRECVGLWFVDYYMGLILVAPFLSLLAKSLSKVQYQLLLAVLVFINITVFGRFGTALGVVNSGFSLQYFILLYFVGGYIRLFNPFSNKRQSVVGIVVFTVLQLLVQVIHSFVHGFGSFNQVNFVYSGLVFFVSVFVFIWVKNYSFSSILWKPFVKVAPYTFAVYLFSENRYMRNYLWCEIISPRDYVNDVRFIPIMIFVCLMVFAIGVIIDYIRELAVRKINGGKMLDAFNNRVEKFCVPYIKRKLI